LTAFYGDTLADVTLPAHFTWAAPTTTSVGEPGNRSFQVTYTPEEVCYNTVTGITVTVTVSKATPSITAVPSASAITYGEPCRILAFRRDGKRSR
jgi:hypothetical protein